MRDVDLGHGQRAWGGTRTRCPNTDPDRARARPPRRGHQPVMTLAKVHRPRRHHDPRPRARDDHRSALSAEAIAAIRPASMSPSKRTVTPRASIETEPSEPRPGSGARSTSAVANAGSRSQPSTTNSGSVDDASVSLPRRARFQRPGAQSPRFVRLARHHDVLDWWYHARVGRRFRTTAAPDGTAGNWNPACPQRAGEAVQN